MCLLTYFPPGVAPDCQALRNGAVNNDDGHGFAIVAGQRLIVRRSLVAETLIETFATLRTKYPDGPALFHSRFGTGGIYTTYNCHPFQLGADKLTVIAHNGVLGKVKVPKWEKRCDTRIAAETIFPHKFNIGDPHSRAELAEWVGKHNKLAILTVNPAYDAPAYLVNGTGGIWSDGIWYSNLDYLPQNDRWAQYAADWIGDMCRHCGQADTVDRSLGVCLFCDMCVDCGQHWRTDCQCWTPGQRDRSDDDDDDAEALAARLDWQEIAEKYSHVTD